MSNKLVRLAKNRSEILEEIETISEKLQNSLTESVTNENEELIQRLLNERSVVLSIFVIILVLILLVASVSSRYISTPLNNIISAANLLGRGDVKARARIFGTDELGDMAANFNNMADQLEENINSQFKIKDELKLVNVQLEKRVRERTQELTDKISELEAAEVELIQSTEEAESANRAKSDFLSSMSHELRTPMNAIMGFGQLLEFNPKEPLSEKQLEHTQQILKGGQHLLDLIDQVLELSKIEAGKVSLSVEKVRPTDVITECLTMVSERAGENNVTLVDQTNKSAIPILRTDKNRFRQILLNLLSNAIKYNRPGGSVTITSGLVSEGFQRISIIDTGKGIPQKKRSGLFEPFDRLGLEAGEIEGTGIGLTITKQLIDLLGGSLGYTSEENVGSNFWIELPLSEDQSSLKQNETEKTVSAETVKVGDNQSRTVLYIEDNQVNMVLMKEIVGRHSNLTMLTAPDAETGLDVAKNQIPDLILMDINLPGMDGIEALAKLRLEDKTKKIPVIALSAAAMPHEIKRGKEAGFEEYITKPINVAEILAAFNTHIG